MDAAAVLHVTTRVASLKHQGSLSTDQFVLLKDNAKEGLVTDQVFENLSLAWKMPRDGSVDEAEYEEDLRMIVKWMHPGGCGSRIRGRVAREPGAYCSFLFVWHRKAKMRKPGSWRDQLLLSIKAS